MEESRPRWQYVRDLRPVLLVALGVVVAGTVFGAVTDKVHRVAAEQLRADDVLAVAGPNNTQRLAVGNWSVAFVAPLAAEMPLLRYAQLSPDSVGLSSADLAKTADDCTAARSGLGTLIRYPTGSFGTKITATPGANLVGAIGEYEYVYQFPHNACLDNPAGMELVNRQEAVVLEALSSLATGK